MRTETRVEDELAQDSKVRKGLKQIYGNAARIRGMIQRNIEHQYF
jgi:hypothetical protein